MQDYTLSSSFQSSFYLLFICRLSFISFLNLRDLRVLNLPTLLRLVLLRVLPTKDRRGCGELAKENCQDEGAWHINDLMI